jgi:uncharacterized protein DUF4129
VKDRLMFYYLAVKQWTQEMLGRLIVDREWGPVALLKLSGALAGGALILASLYVLISYRQRRRLPPTGYGPWWHRLFILPMWRRKSRRDYRQSAVLFYEQMLAIARRAGLIKQPDQTPIEFAEASGLASIREITLLYNRVRFGGGKLDARETGRVSDLLSHLRQTIRNRRRMQ